MRRETGEAIHPDDAEFLRRRQVLGRGLLAATVGSIAIEVGAMGHILYQAEKNHPKVVEILKAHPNPSDEAVAQATKILEEQNTYHDIPDRKVKWAQEQLILKKAFDEEFARQFPNGTVPWEETDHEVGIGAGALGIASITTWRIVRSRTRRELSRRDFLRRIAGNRAEMEQ